jgi:hypothetical protein
MENFTNLGQLIFLPKFILKLIYQASIWVSHSPPACANE